MKDQTKTSLIVIYVVCIIVGLLLFCVGFTSLLPPVFDPKGVRVTGMGLFSLGLGECLNHPLLTRRVLRIPSDTVSPKIPTHRRTPCCLGNIFDLLAIISFFAAVTYFFFSPKA